MSDFNQPSEILISCRKYILPALEAEVAELGYTALEKGPTHLSLNGTLKDCIDLCFFLKTAARVAWLVGKGTAMTAEEAYLFAKSLPWENWIPENGYFTIQTQTDTPAIKNSMFASVKLKDAIVDRMREKTGKRPDSGSSFEKTVVFVFWKHDQIKIYLDAGGETLARHGYRQIPFKAPLQESLAVALLHASGWKPGIPLINPMCGSGTLAIEAALAAAAFFPADSRQNFGFRHLKGYRKSLELEVRRKRNFQPVKTSIIASDHDPEALFAAEKNAKEAGVASLIRFEKCDFAETTIPEGNGLVILNPPYGERLGEMEELSGLYPRIGDFFKQKCPGKTGAVITGNPELGKKIGLKPSAKIPFLNGNMECRLLLFELFSGTRKTAHNNL